jgi:hypothetical protein
LNKTLKSTAIALAFVGTAAIGIATAGAAEVVTFDPGAVAYGYSDGYWTRTHEWHAWGKPEYMQAYRARPGAVYHDWHHDRDADMGWHEVK